MSESETSVASLRRMLGGKVARSALGSLTLRGISLGLGLVLNAMLARWLAPSGFGRYAFAFTVMVLFVMPLQSGAPAFLVRQIATYQARKQWDLLHGLLRMANAGVAALVVLGAVVLAVVMPSIKLPAGEVWMWLWALALVPLYALGALRGAALRGLRHAVQGQLPEQLLRPLLFVLMLSVVWYCGSTHGTPAQAMAIHVAAMGIAFIVGAVLLLRALPSEVRTAVPTYEAANWLKAILPFTLLAGMQVLNGSLDVLMLGILRPASDVGLFRAGEQFAGLLGFSQIAINLVLAPELARCFAQKNLSRAQQLCVWSARCMLATALPLGVVFLFFGGRVIGLFYGPDYVAAWPVLAILSISGLVNAACGPNGSVSNMSGHERHTARAVAEALGLNAILNVTLIPHLGATGAAIGTAASVLYWNFRLSLKARRLSGVACTAFSSARYSAQP